MSRFVYFQSDDYHSIHSQFYKDFFPGQIYKFKAGRYQHRFPKDLYRLDSKDTIWFFNDIYYFLHSNLKGRQIHINHGLGFAKPINRLRAYYLEKFFFKIFSTGVPNERYMLSAGVNPKKIVRVGYTPLFYIPDIPMQPKTILFCSARYTHWNHFENFLELLKQVPEDWNAYVSIHAHSTCRFSDSVESICRDKKNLHRVKTDEQLMQAYAICRYGLSGGLTSAVTPLHYLGKPVIFLRGHSCPLGYAKYKGIGWKGIRRYINYDLFDEVLNESFCISKPSEMVWANLHQIAKPSHSSKKIFYSEKFSSKEAQSMIGYALELESRGT